MALDKINDNIEREFNKHIDSDWEQPNIAARDAIPTYKRYPGMEVNVQDAGEGDPQLYKLNVKRGGDLSDNTKWVPFIPVHVESISQEDIDNWNAAATGNVTIADDLETQNPAIALSANMGFVLSQMIGDLTETVNTLEITDIGGLTEALNGLVLESTDDLPEGEANLYFTAERVLLTALTGLTGASGQIQNGDTIPVALSKLQSQINAINSGGNSKGILSGGVTWVGPGMTYDVSVQYNYYGTVGYASEQKVANNGDATFDRIDAFVVNSAGAISIIQGTPSETPLQPVIGEDQILIQFRIVPANETQPPVAQIVVYDENDPGTEWVHSTYDTGGGSVAPVDFASIDTAAHGTFSLFTETHETSGIKFTTPSAPVIPAQHPSLSLRVFLQDIMKGDNERVILYANSSNEIPLVLNTYGLDPTNIGVWQHLIIPTADFKVSEIQDLFLRVAGTNAEPKRIRFDWIIFTSEITTPPGNAQGVYVYDDETLVGQTLHLNFDNFTITVEGNMVTVKYVETDPTVPEHVKQITSTQIENWDNAAIISGQSGKYIVSGGAVWNSGLMYDVDVIFNYFGTTGSATEQITLTAADSTLPRIDAIVVNSSGDIYSKEGTPSLEAVQPAIAEDEILIQIALIDAGALEPTITVNTVYDEADPEEWSRESYQLEGIIDGTVDFSHPTGAFSGSVCIRSNTTRTTGLRFYVPSPINFMEFSALVFRVKFNTPLPAGRKLLSSVWLNGMPVGSVLNFANYGLNPELVGVWQTIITPTSAYNVYLIDRIHLRMEGPGGSGDKVEYFVDTVSFSTEAVEEPSVPFLIGLEQQASFVANANTLNFGDDFELTAQSDGKVKVEYTGTGTGGDNAKLTDDTTFFDI